VKKINSKKPLVTIITPTFNRAGYLEETIKSVLSQEYKNFEYIVLDDGSTDNTREILQKYKSKIIWKAHKNIGEVPTVNKGLSLAKGKIIAIVNSDDPLLPGAINTFVNLFINNPKIIVAYSDWIVIDEKGRKVKNFITRDYDYKYMVRTHNCPLGASAFFRKSLLETIGKRDEGFKYVSDFDFWLRAGLIGDFARIPKFLATSRIHPGQATIKDRSYTMALDHIKVINKLYSLPNVPDDIKKIKRQAYDSACEAVRISRGNSFSMKLLSLIISIYYSRGLYLKTFINFRLNYIKNFVNLN
jgi:glycosyltransferase involved in cell wall biosynthesis